MFLVREIKLPINTNIEKLNKKISDILKLDHINKKGPQPFFSLKIVRRSIDARKKPDIYYSYTCLVDFGEEEDRVKKYLLQKKVKNISFEVPNIYQIPENGDEPLTKRPVIVGSGPCGIFAAYLLALKGYKPIILERGEEVTKRLESVKKFWDSGTLNTDSNIQFGEGGAGTFSDGKLATSTKDKTGRGDFVLKTYASLGANEDIIIDAKPHIGTDVLIDVVKNMRNKIISLGGEFRFDTRFDDFETDTLGNITKVYAYSKNKQITIETNILVLAIGHSARDTFENLYSKGVDMIPKNFAVGFRVIHPQENVDMWQYGVNKSKEINLKAADYKVTNEASNGRSVYSFCMCPGGYVVNASSELTETCVNGMSEYHRDSGFANSAIVCSITPNDFIQDEVDDNHPLRGMYYQRRLENDAYRRGNGSIPIQTFKDFELNIKNRNAQHICNNETISINAIKGKCSWSNLAGIYSESIDEAIVESMHKFGYTRECFDSDDVILCGVETRTSSPVRINRNDELESNIKGLYPCGEGAGYAGGITSAAMDGMKIAETIIKKYKPAY